MYKGGIKLRIFMVLIIGLTSFVHAEDRPYGAIDAIKSPMEKTIDGYLDDWEGTQWHIIADGAPYVTGQFSYFLLKDDGESEPKGTALTHADLSAFFSLQWDNNFLYMAVEVIDNVRDLNEKSDNSVWFLKDAVSLFLDVAGDKDGFEWNVGDHSFSFTADNNVPNWWRYGDENGQREVPMHSSVKSAVVQGNDGNYSLEVAIPMKVLSEFTPDWKEPFDGKSMGFSLLITDVDGLRPSQLSQLMYGGDGDNDESWSLLRLVDDSSNIPKYSIKNLGTIRGKVTYGDNSLPWTNGQINVKSLDGKFTRSFSVNENGNFEVAVPPDEYKISVGYQTIEVRVRQDKIIDDLDFNVVPVIAQLNLPSVMSDSLKDFYSTVAIPILKKNGFIQWTIDQSNEHKKESHFFSTSNTESFLRGEIAVETDKQWNYFASVVLKEININSASLLNIYHAPVAPKKEHMSSESFVHKYSVQKNTVGTGNQTEKWWSYGLPDGLTEPAIWDIIQGKDGKLWLSTGARESPVANSLTIFDGEYFGKVFVEEKNMRVNAVVDDDGVPWFSGVQTDLQGTTYFPLGYFANDVWNLISFPEEVSRSFTTAFAKGKDGSIWIGSSRGILNYNDGLVKFLSVEDGLLSNSISSIATDRSGNTYFGTLSGLSIYDGKRIRNYSAPNGLMKKEIKVLKEDRSGNMWIGTDKGLFSLEKNEINYWGKEYGLEQLGINTLEIDQDNVMWVGTESGLYQFDKRKSKMFTRLGDFGEVRKIYEDVDGIVWVGTNEGLSRYDKDKFKYIEVDNVPLRENTQFLERSLSGNIWFGSENKLTEYRANTESFHSYESKDDIVSLLIHDDKTWIACKGKTYFLKNKEWQESSSFGGSDQWVSSTRISADKSGRIWHRSQFGLHINDHSGDWKRFTSNGFFEGELFGPLPGFLEDRDGYFWFSSLLERLGNFLVRWDGDKWKSFDYIDNSPKSTPTYALQHSDNSIWFGTVKEGIFKFNNGAFTHFPVSMGIPLYITSLAEDSRGRLWISSGGGGVAVFDGEALQTLSVADGLSSNTVNRVLGDNNGDIWIATNNGLSVYSPSKESPSVSIVEVVADQLYDGSEIVSLPSSQEFISVKFKGAGFKTRAEHMKYAYRYRSANDAQMPWNVIENDFVELTDLSIGDFIFEVKAIDRDLNYSAIPATINVSVKPPYTKIFYMGFLFFAVVALGVSGNSLVKRKQELRKAETERDQAKELLLQELSEELETARKMQMSLMPACSPDIKGYDVSGRCRPATEVGGDFYQYFNLSNNRFAVVMADVTGHGMEAAIPNALFSGILDSQMELDVRGEKLFQNLNKSLCRNLDKRKFVCFSFVEVDILTGKVQLMNAGCPYPYYYQDSTEELKEIRIDALPLGAMLNSKYELVELQLEIGDSLVFCSDGIIEAENEMQDILGYDETMSCVKKSIQSSDSGDEVVQKIFEKVDQHSGVIEQTDDQTVIVVRYA